MTAPFDFIRPLTEEEYAGLKADIAAHGQLVAILRDQNGTTLDGHHREKALTEIGVPIADWKIHTKYFADDDARNAAVLSANHHRRHLKPEDRQQLIRYFDSLGWTQQRIAKELGVAQSTVSLGIGNLSKSINSQPTKTATNPKGAGRPKKAKVNVKQAATTAALAAVVAAGGTAKRPGHKYDLATEKTAAAAVLNAGQSIPETAAQLGISEQVVIRAVEFERGFRAARADPEIRLEDITSIPQRKRAEAAIRQQVAAYVKQLDDHYGTRLANEIKQHMKDVILPDYLKRLREANEVMRARLQGVFKPEEYRLILSCLHSDGQRSVERLDKAFKTFKAREKSLLSEKDDPTPDITGMPKTWEDMEKLRAVKKAEDRAKREAAKKAKEAGHSPVDTR